MSSPKLNQDAIRKRHLSTSPIKRTQLGLQGTVDRSAYIPKQWDTTNDGDIIKAIDNQLLAQMEGPYVAPLSHQIAPLFQSTVGRFLHSVGIEPPPTTHDDKLTRYIEHVERIDKIVAGGTRSAQNEHDEMLKLRQSIVVLNEDTEETFVDPGTSWGHLTPFQRKRILYKKRVDLAHGSAAPQSYSEMDGVPKEVFSEIEKNSRNGLNFVIDRTYSEPLLFQSVSLRAESGTFRFSEQEGSHGRHIVGVGVRNGDLEVGAQNDSNGTFLANLSLTLPSLNTHYSYERLEHQLPFEQVFTKHRVQYQSDNWTIWELEQKDVDRDLISPTTSTSPSTHSSFRPTTTTESSTTLSTCKQVTQNLHLGMKMKVKTTHPTLQETKTQLMTSLLFRYRDFFRIIWDDKQCPYPLEAKSDTTVEISSQGQLDMKLWRQLSDNEHFSAFLTLNPWKNAHQSHHKWYLPDIVNGAIAYIWQNDPNQTSYTVAGRNSNPFNEGYGQGGVVGPTFGGQVNASTTDTSKWSTYLSNFVPQITPFPFTGGLLARTNGYVGAIIGSAVPGLESLYFRANLGFNLLNFFNFRNNLGSPTMGITFEYNSEHRPGYDTTKFMTPHGFEYYRLAVLPNAEDYYDFHSTNSQNNGQDGQNGSPSPISRFSKQILTYHQKMLNLLWSRDHRKQYYHKHKHEIDGHAELFLRHHLEKNGVKTTPSPPSGPKKSHFDGNLIRLYPEDDLTALSREEWLETVHSDDFIARHPVLSQLPHRMAQLFNGTDDKNHIVMPSQLALKRFSQRTVFPLPLDHQPGQVSMPRFANDETEHMYYWGWFLRQKDTVLPQTVKDGVENPTIRFWMSIFRFQHLQSKLDQIKILTTEQSRIAKHLNYFSGGHKRPDNTGGWQDYRAYQYHESQIKNLTNFQKSLLVPYYSSDHPLSPVSESSSSPSSPSLKSAAQRRSEDVMRHNDIGNQLQELQFDVAAIHQSEALQRLTESRYDEGVAIAKRLLWAQKFGVDPADREAMAKYDEYDLLGGEVEEQIANLVKSHQQSNPEAHYLATLTNLNNDLVNYTQSLAATYGIDIQSLITTNLDQSDFELYKDPMAISSKNQQNVLSNQNWSLFGEKDPMASGSDTTDKRSYYGLDFSLPHPVHRINVDSATTPLERYMGVKAMYLNYEAQKRKNSEIQARKKSRFGPNRAQDLADMEALLAKSPMELDSSVDNAVARKAAHVGGGLGLNRNEQDDERFMLLDRLTKPFGHFAIDMYVGVNNAFATLRNNLRSSLEDAADGEYYDPNDHSGQNDEKSDHFELFSPPTIEPPSTPPPHRFAAMFPSSRSDGDITIQLELDNNTSNNNNTQSTIPPSPDPQLLGSYGNNSSTRLMRGGVVPKQTTLQQINTSLSSPTTIPTISTPLPETFGEYARDMSIKEYNRELRDHWEEESGIISDRKLRMWKNDGIFKTLSSAFNDLSHSLFGKYGLEDPEYHPISERQIAEPLERQFWAQGDMGSDDNINSDDDDEYDDDNLINTNTTSKTSKSHPHQSLPTQTLLINGSLFDLGPIDPETGLPALNRSHVDQEALLFARYNDFSSQQFRDLELNNLSRQRQLGLYDHQMIERQREERLKQRLEAQKALAVLEQNEKILGGIDSEAKKIQSDKEHQDRVEAMLLSKKISPEPYTLEFEAEMLELQEKGKELDEKLRVLEQQILTYDEKMLELQVRALENPSNHRFQDTYRRAKEDREGIIEYYNKERKENEKIANELESLRTEVLFRYTHRNTLLSQQEIDEHNVASQDRFKQAILQAEIAGEVYQDQLEQMALYGKDQFLAKNPIILSDGTITSGTSGNIDYNMAIDPRFDAKKALIADQRKQLLLLSEDDLEAKLYQSEEERIKTRLLAGQNVYSDWIDDVDSVDGRKRGVIGSTYQNNIPKSKEELQLIQDLSRQHGYYPFHLQDRAQTQQKMRENAIGAAYSSTLKGQDRDLAMVAAGVIDTTSLPLDISGQHSEIFKKFNQHGSDLGLNLSQTGSLSNPKYANLDQLTRDITNVDINVDNPFAQRSFAHEEHITQEIAKRGDSNSNKTLVNKYPKSLPPTSITSSTSHSFEFAAPIGTLNLTTYDHDNNNQSTTTTLMSKSSLKYAVPHHNSLNLPYTITSPDNDTFVDQTARNRPGARIYDDQNEATIVDVFNRRSFDLPSTPDPHEPQMPLHVKRALFREIDDFVALNGTSDDERRALQENVDVVWKEKQHLRTAGEIATERRDRYIARQAQIDTDTRLATSRHRFKGQSGVRLGLLDSDRVVGSLLSTPQQRRKALSLRRLTTELHASSSNEEFDRNEAFLKTTGQHPDLLHSTPLYTPRSVQPAQNWQKNVHNVNRVGFPAQNDSWDPNNPSRGQKINFRDNVTGKVNSLLVPPRDPDGNFNHYVNADGNINKAYHPSNASHMSPTRHKRSGGEDSEEEDDWEMALIAREDYPQGYDGTLHDPSDLSQSISAPVIDPTAFVLHDHRRVAVRMPDGRIGRGLVKVEGANGDKIPMAPTKARQIAADLSQNRITNQLQQHHEAQLHDRYERAKHDYKLNRRYQRAEKEYQQRLDAVKVQFGAQPSENYDPNAPAIRYNPITHQHDRYSTSAEAYYDQLREEDITEQEMAYLRQRQRLLEQNNRDFDGTLDPDSTSSNRSPHSAQGNVPTRMRVSRDAAPRNEHEYVPVQDKIWNEELQGFKQFRKEAKEKWVENDELGQVINSQSLREREDALNENPVHKTQGRDGNTPQLWDRNSYPGDDLSNSFTGGLGADNVHGMTQARRDRNQALMSGRHASQTSSKSVFDHSSGAKFNDGPGQNGRH